jgi:hypothetical protein
LTSPTRELSPQHSPYGVRQLAAALLRRGSPRRLPPTAACRAPRAPSLQNPVLIATRLAIRIPPNSHSRNSFHRPQMMHDLHRVLLLKCGSRFEAARQTERAIAGDLGVGRGERMSDRIANILGGSANSAKPGEIFNRQPLHSEIPLSYSKQRPAPIVNRQLFLFFFFAHNFHFPAQEVASAAHP